MFYKLLRILFFILIVALVFSACKTSRLATEAKIKPLSASKIIRNIEENSLDYKYFTIRRVNCQYEDDNEKTSFRANVKCIKDEVIVVSFNKLNIPFGRIQLSPDSVKFINYIDKTYFLGDYSFLKEIFNIELTFSDVQAILSNNIFSYRNLKSRKDFVNFSSIVDSGMYVLQSVNRRKLDKIENKDKYQKYERLIKRFKDEAFILQTISVAPVSFNVKNIKIENRSGHQSVNFEFDNYTPFEKRNYPGEIIMKFNSKKNNIRMRIKMNGLSTDKIEKLNFNIPQKYEQVMLSRK